VAANVDYTLPASNTVEVLNMLGSGLTGTGTKRGRNVHQQQRTEHAGRARRQRRLLPQQHRRRGGPKPRTAASTPWEATVDYTLPASNTVEALVIARLRVDRHRVERRRDAVQQRRAQHASPAWTGDDLYYVNNPGDVVVEAANGGSDTVIARVDYTMRPTSRDSTCSAPA
jgi:hypothetical protein